MKTERIKLMWNKREKRERERERNHEKPRLVPRVLGLSN